MTMASRTGRKWTAPANPFANTPTNPLLADSDSDGLTDGEEISGSQNPFGNAPTDPNEADSDGDGATDPQEIAFNFDPNDPNSSPPPWQRGLRGFWSFDDTLEDGSGLQHHGTLFGSDTVPRYAPGKLGRSILLDGRTGFNQYVEVAGNEGDLDFPGASMTVSAWVRFSFAPSDEPCIVAKGTDPNWRLALNGSSTVLRFAGGADFLEGGGSIRGPVWHHAVGVAEAGVGTRLYVDGLLVAVGGPPMLGNSTVPMQIGGNPELGDRNWSGLIDEVAVWGRALSTGEVRQLWNAGQGAKVGELVLGNDTDGDGMSDEYEVAHGLDPNLDDSALDPDADNLTNLEEHDAGSDPSKADSDDDGLRDDAELAAGTNPVASDSDGDGLTDGEELEPGEDGFVTNPLNPDTDGDGFSDGSERFSDPTDPNDFPGLELDLIAYFPLDGDLLDRNPINPGAHDGTFRGSAPAAYRAAQLGDGLDLNGVDQYVTIGGPESDVEFVGGSMTISAWFSIPTFQRQWQCLIGKGEGNSWRVHRQQTLGHMTFTGGNADIQGADFTSTPAVADGQMHHLVAIAEHGVSSRLWIDGTLVGTRSNPAPESCKPE